MAKSVPPAKLYQLKVTLHGSKPPIWRRLVVSGDLRLDQLHEVIQVAMPWTNSHLHWFIAKSKTPKPTREEVDRRILSGKPVDPAWVSGLRYLSHPAFEMEDTEDESKVRLDELAPERRAKFVYEYDMGDSWQHEVRVEKITDPDAGTACRPHCTDGQFACPPDDCGGIWGYYRMLDVLADEEHEEHEDMLDWLGEGFDPEYFDVDEVNRYLGKLKVGRRRRR
jgi:hypothetical protein